jgi:hypothetical protein
MMVNSAGTSGYSAMMLTLRSDVRDGELGGNVGILGDDFDAARGHLRDDAVARQRAGARLNLRSTSAERTFAFGSKSRDDHAAS